MHKILSSSSSQWVCWCVSHSGRRIAATASSKARLIPLLFCRWSPRSGWTTATTRTLSWVTTAEIGLHRVSRATPPARYRCCSLLSRGSLLSHSSYWTPLSASIHSRSQLLSSRESMQLFQVSIFTLILSPYSCFTVDNNLWLNKTVHTSNCIGVHIY